MPTPLSNDSIFGEMMYKAAGTLALMCIEEGIAADPKTVELMVKAYQAGMTAVLDIITEKMELIK